MSGNSHYLFGAAVAVSTAAVGISTDNPYMVMGACVIPPMAMFPDIDHWNSKIGRMRVKTQETLKKIIVYGLLGYFLLSIYGIMKDGFDFMSVLKVLIIMAPPVLTLLLINSKPMQSLINSMFGHRKIMHTLIIPAIFIYASLSIDNETIKWLLIGMTAGYCSHLFTDCQTKDGCPLLWPIIPINIKVPLLSTTILGEVLTLWIDILIIAILTWMWLHG